jgi:transcriptional regulator with XRE-family HTH domain
MGAGELRVVREYLGLSGDQLAALIGVHSRSVRRWESSQRDEDGRIRWPVPDGIRELLEDLERRAAREVDALVAFLETMPEPTVVTYRSDQEVAAAHPGSRWPASWYRAIAGRAIQDVPRARVQFLADALTDGGSLLDSLALPET